MESGSAPPGATVAIGTRPGRPRSICQPRPCKRLPGHWRKLGYSWTSTLLDVPQEEGSPLPVVVAQVAPDSPSGRGLGFAARGVPLARGRQSQAKDARSDGRSHFPDRIGRVQVVESILQLANDA